jgi:hypothetical protein
MAEEVLRNQGRLPRRAGRGFLVTRRGPLMRGPSIPNAEGPTTVAVDGPHPDSDSRRSDTISQVASSPPTLFFHARVPRERRSDTGDHTGDMGMAMPGVRLTKAEKEHLLETALREKARRRNANRKAREIRSAQGRHRLEKTVPAHHLAAIRRLVAAVVADMEAGREPRLRPVRARQWESRSRRSRQSKPGPRPPNLRRRRVPAVWDRSGADGPRPPAAANDSARRACRGPPSMSRPNWSTEYPS